MTITHLYPLNIKSTNQTWVSYTIRCWSMSFPIYIMWWILYMKFFIFVFSAWLYTLYFYNSKVLLSIYELVVINLPFWHRLFWQNFEYTNSQWWWLQHLKRKRGVNFGYSNNSIMFNLINYLLILIFDYTKQKLTCPISTGRSYSIVVYITTEDWIKDFLFLFPIIYLTPSRNRSNRTEKEKIYTSWYCFT